MKFLHIGFAAKLGAVVNLYLLILSFNQFAHKNPDNLLIIKHAIW